MFLLLGLPKQKKNLPHRPLPLFNLSHRVKNAGEPWGYVKKKCLKQISYICWIITLSFNMYRNKHIGYALYAYVQNV